MSTEQWEASIGLGFIILLILNLLFFKFIYSCDELNFLYSIIPAVIYPNVDIDKKRIVKDNKNKSGIYCWTNLKSNKKYIGSSINLGSRLKDYFNYSFLILPKNKGMLIYKALLKHGYTSFRLEILEYCDKLNCIDREQYYIDFIKPEYNLLSKAGSSFGYKHSKDSLIKVRNHLAKLNESKGFLVEIYNIETNDKFIIKSIRKAAMFLNCDKSTITYQAKIQNNDRSKLFRNKYKIILK